LKAKKWRKSTEKKAWIDQLELQIACFKTIIQDLIHLLHNKVYNTEKEINAIQDQEEMLLS
jgi:hypothetical protein